jgi:hypothetical protein
MVEGCSNRKLMTLDVIIQTMFDLGGDVMIPLPKFSDEDDLVGLRQLSYFRFGDQCANRNIIFSSGVRDGDHLFLFQRFQARHRYILRTNQADCMIWTTPFRRMPI